MSGKSQSFISQPDGWVTATIGGAAITAQQGCDATIAYAGLGLYDVTFVYPVGTTTNGANGGIGVDISAAAGRFVRVIHTSDVLKRIVLTSSANAAADATRIRVSGKRLSGG